MRSQEVQIGSAIYTKHGDSDKMYLRISLLLSGFEDNQINMLSFYWNNHRISLETEGSGYSAKYYLYIPCENVSAYNKELGYSSNTLKIDSGFLKREYSTKFSDISAVFQYYDSKGNHTVTEHVTTNMNAKLLEGKPILYDGEEEEEPPKKPKPKPEPGPDEKPDKDKEKDDDGGGGNGGGNGGGTGGGNGGGDTGNGGDTQTPETVTVDACIDKSDNTLLRITFPLDYAGYTAAFFDSNNDAFADGEIPANGVAYMSEDLYLGKNFITIKIYKSLNYYPYVDTTVKGIAYLNNSPYPTCSSRTNSGRSPHDVIFKTPDSKLTSEYKVKYYSANDPDNYYWARYNSSKNGFDLKNWDNIPKNTNDHLVFEMYNETENPDSVCYAYTHRYIATSPCASRLTQQIIGPKDTAEVIEEEKVSETEENIDEIKAPEESTETEATEVEIKEENAESEKAEESNTAETTEQTDAVISEETPSESEDPAEETLEQAEGENTEDDKLAETEEKSEETKTSEESTETKATEVEIKEEIVEIAEPERTEETDSTETTDQADSVAKEEIPTDNHSPEIESSEKAEVEISENIN